MEKSKKSPLQEKLNSLKSKPCKKKVDFNPFDSDFVLDELESMEEDWF